MFFEFLQLTEIMSDFEFFRGKARARLIAYLVPLFKWQIYANECLKYKVADVLYYQ